MGSFIYDARLKSILYFTLGKNAGVVFETSRHTCQVQIPSRHGRVSRGQEGGPTARKRAMGPQSPKNTHLKTKSSSVVKLVNIVKRGSHFFAVSAGKEKIIDRVYLQYIQSADRVCV